VKRWELLTVERACKESSDIYIKYKRFFFMGKGHDGGCGVFTDAREFSKFSFVVRNSVVVLGGDDCCGFVKTERATGITESSPGYE
jgi:hypothetical protein